MLSTPSSTWLPGFRLTTDALRADGLAPDQTPFAHDQYGKFKRLLIVQARIDVRLVRTRQIRFSEITRPTEAFRDVLASQFQMHPAETRSTGRVDVGRVHYYMIFPSAFFSFHPDYVHVHPGRSDAHRPRLVSRSRRDRRVVVIRLAEALRTHRTPRLIARHTHQGFHSNPPRKITSGNTASNAAKPLRGCWPMESK